MEDATNIHDHVGDGEAYRLPDVMSGDPPAEAVRPPRTIMTMPPNSPAVTSPMSMIERAVMSGAGIEVVEKLVDLHERFEERAARRAFANAIAAARAEIKPIVKTGEVDFSTSKGRTNYRHETLSAIAEQIDPVLARHGLSYRFRSRQDGGILHITCIVAHRDGYFEETTLSGPGDQSGNKNAYQAIGSAASYLQRYTLKLALGLAAAQDDDGHTADKKPGVIEAVSAEQFVELRDLAEEAGVDPRRICKDYECESLEQFPAASFDNAMNRLRTTIRNRQQAQGAGDTYQRRDEVQHQAETQRQPARPDPAQMSVLRAEIHRAGLSADDVAMGMGVQSIDDLTLDGFTDALRRVRATIRQNEARQSGGPGDYDTSGY